MIFRRKSFDLYLYKIFSSKNFHRSKSTGFSKEIQRLNGKEVIIRGYLVPVDKTTWALSKNTYAACFFCGKAGPETVVGLTFASDPGKLKMDANALIKGTFVLNGTNVDDWMYSLTDARIISVR